MGARVLLTSFFFFSSRRRHTRWPRDWSSDVCSSDLFGSSCSAPDQDENLLRLLHPLWRPAEFQRLPGVPWFAGDSPRTEQARCGNGHARRARPELHGSRTLAFCPEKLLLSRPPQRLSNLAIRIASRHWRLAGN